MEGAESIEKENGRHQRRRGRQRAKSRIKSRVNEDRWEGMGLPPWVRVRVEERVRQVETLSE